MALVEPQAIITEDGKDMVVEKIFRISGIRKELHDVKTFELDGYMDFTPGQYCLVRIPDRIEQRPVTMANSPEDKIRFTLKQIGGWTTEIHSLDKGECLAITGPQETSLNFNPLIKRGIVFIAGGSGITPFISVLRYAVRNKLKNNFTLFFSNRKKRDILFREELNSMGRRKNIKVVHTLTREDWHGEKGRVSQEMISRHITFPKNKLWYVCGPPSMVKSVRDTLKSMGIPKGLQRSEDWQIMGKQG